MSDCIVETSDGVMAIRFNRPEKMNAMGGTLMQEFDAALAEGNASDNVKAFVVTGEGRAWCAGADLTAMAGRGGGEQPNRRAAALDRIGPGRTVLALHYSEKPTIAAVNGVAVGGGFGLCSAFDIRIASEEARFGTIFIKRGLAPDYGLSWYLPRLVGGQRAREMFYSGRIVGAQEALELGIVTKVVAPDQLMDEAVGFAREIAKHPPTALTYTRRALRQSYSNTIEAQLEFEWANQKMALASAEFREATVAFIEKREADFSKV